MFQAQVGFHNRLPCRLRRRLFGGMKQGIAGFPESLAQRFHEQVVLAPEMLVKASVSQASVPHNSRHRRTI